MNIISACSRGIMIKALNSSYSVKIAFGQIPFGRVQTL